MTYLELITRAYRLRNVIDETEQPSAEQGVEGLTSLNQMMAEWLANDINLQYIPVDAAQLADTLTLPDYSLAGVTAQLAIRIVCGSSITPELQTQASDGLATIERKAVQEELGSISLDHISAGSGSCRGTFWK